jgi:hypothetical protein
VTFGTGSISGARQELGNSNDGYDAHTRPRWACTSSNKTSLH